MIMARKSRSEIKREFEAFAQKIAKLEALKREVGMLERSYPFVKEDLKIIKVQLHDVNAIGRIEKALFDVKKKISSRENTGEKTSRNISEIKKKIKELEEKIKKKQVSRSEIEKVGEIPKLERELHNLRNAFKEHTSSQKIKIDAGVGTLVDSRFDDFVNEIKASISQRIKEKEASIDEKLVQDLKDREGLFRQKYTEVVQELHEKYKHMVENDLKKEVRDKFEKELRKRLSEEEKKMALQLMKEYVEKISHDRRQLMHRLDSDYRKKEKILYEQVFDEKMKAKNSIDTERKKVSSKLKLFEKERARLDSRDRKRQNVLFDKKKELESEMRRAKDMASNALNKARMILARKQAEISAERKRNREVLSEKEAKLKLRLARASSSVKKRIQARIEKIKSKTQKAFDRKIERIDRSYRKNVKLKEAENRKNIAEREHAKLIVEMNRLKKQEGGLNKERRDLENKFKRKKKEFSNAFSNLKKHEQKIIIGAKEEARKKLKAQEEIHNSMYSRKVALLKGKMHAELKKSVAELKRKSREKIEDAAKNREQEFREMQRKHDESIVNNMRKKVSEIKKEGKKRLGQALKSKEAELRREFAKSFNFKLKDSLEKKEKMMKEEFERSFAIRLKEAMKKKEKELEKKKEILERHVLEQAKKLFN